MVINIIEFVKLVIFLIFNLKGGTRIVFLTKKYAFKIPTFKSYKLFINGIQANLEEKN